MDTYYYNDVFYQAFAGIFFMIFIVALVFGIISIIALWKIYEKAGVEGWKSLIPIYNAYCLYQITWGNGWLFLTCFIPFVNFVIPFITLHRLSKSFGYSIGFTLGLIFLSPIFFLILAFGSAEYKALPPV